MTVGERINQLVKEYITLYNVFKDDPEHPCHKQAKGMALHDLEMKAFIFNQATKEVEQYIQANA